jgi:hypothetical protein
VLNISGGVLMNAAALPLMRAMPAKDHAAKLGLNPKEFGAHSLRAGFATSSGRIHFGSGSRRILILSSRCDNGCSRRRLFMLVFPHDAAPITGRI